MDQGPGDYGKYLDLKPLLQADLHLTSFNWNRGSYFLYLPE